MRFTFLFAGFLQAVWMLFEAFPLLRGTADPAAQGTWARLVAAVGLDPLRFGPVFLIFGILWVIATVAILTGSPRARRPAAALAVASLWFLLEGTALAVIYLIALATLRPRAETP